jgi:threonine dehydrogenase-like Zn-dependent dehydrogenase
MKATLMYGAGYVRVGSIPDVNLLEPTDALVRVTRAAICGSDLWPYKLMERTETGIQRGHEFIGIVEAVGKDVRIIKKGNHVIAPFAFSDGTCEFCHHGIHTSCMHGGFFGVGMQNIGGGQSEAVRVPLAGRHAGSVLRQQRRGHPAVNPDPNRRNGNRPPRRGQRSDLSRQTGRCRRGWSGRT